MRKDYKMGTGLHKMDKFAGMETPTGNLKEGIEINIYNDSHKKYVIMTVEDWAKILQVFKESDCETSLVKI